MVLCGIRKFLGLGRKGFFRICKSNGTGDGDENNICYSKDELIQDVGFSMLLNKPSGLTLEQFKKIF